MRNVDVNKLAEVFKIKSKNSVDDFPGTPDGTPPAEQLKKALEKQKEEEEYFPGTPDGTPPAEQLKKALEKQKEEEESFPGTPKEALPSEKIQMEKKVILKKTGKKLIIKKQ